VCVYLGNLYIFFIAMSIAICSAWSIFWYPGYLFEILVLLLGLYNHDLVVFSSISPLEFLVGEMNDPFVYVYCCG
jgi:hypothetical protein